MQLYEYVQREAWAAAREAKAEGKAEDILLFLEEKDNVPSELKERILSEKDEETLRQWLKAAAQSDSIESFREKVLL